MSGEVFVLGVCGSPRTRFNDIKTAVRIISGARDYQDLYSIIYDLGSQKRISNTEALVWMALFGAVREGATIDVVLLNEIYRKGRNEQDDQKLKEKLTVAQGIVLGTPVYFGDCSSYVDLFLSNHCLQNKAFGVVSAGAKRNGGQETTNMYTLMEALSQGAMIVGNGPPTSQYGGTGWAGDVGAILDDNFGLDTSLGTGKRVTEVIKQSRMQRVKPAQITLVTVSYCGSCKMT